MDRIEFVLVSGTMLATAYAVFALGFALFFSVLRLLNFAYAEVYVAGGYAAYEASERGAPFVVQFAAAVAAATLLSLALGSIVFERFAGRSVLQNAIVSIAIALALRNLLQIWFGSSTLTVPGLGSDRALSVLGVAISVHTAFLFAISLVALVLVDSWVRGTTTGRGIRAVAESAHIAASLGINTRRTRAIVFAVGGALAGVAAGLLLPRLSLSPAAGSDLLFKGFAIVVLGGLSIRGIVVASWFVAVAEAATSIYLSPAWVTVVTFGAMAVVMLARPRGLIAEVAVERV